MIRDSGFAREFNWTKIMASFTKCGITIANSAKSNPHYIRKYLKCGCIEKRGNFEKKWKRKQTRLTKEENKGMRANKNHPLK